MAMSQQSGALTRAESGRVGVCDEHFAHDYPRATQKNELKPWQHEHWCLPSVGGEFVAAMEDVLDLYEEPYDAQYPTVCLDEKPVVLHADVHPPVPVQPGQPERVDYEYERQGTRNLFVLVEPLAGWRHVEITAQRTMQDYAKVVRWLVDEVYPHAEYIRLVQDKPPHAYASGALRNLSTCRGSPYSPASGVPLHAASTAVG
jgi:hypothetical protein